MNLVINLNILLFLNLHNKRLNKFGKTFHIYYNDFHGKRQWLKRQLLFFYSGEVVLSMGVLVYYRNSRPTCVRATFV